MSLILMLSVLKQTTKQPKTPQNKKTQTKPKTNKQKEPTKTPPKQKDFAANINNIRHISSCCAKIIIQLWRMIKK